MGGYEIWRWDSKSIEHGARGETDKKAHQTSTVCMVLYGTIATLFAS